MKLGLFIPCYIDQLYPQVGVASMELLEKLGCEVVFLEDLLCCGQPMDNSGYEHLTHRKGYKQPFMEALPGLDYLVCPSASCVYHLTHHLLKDDELHGKIKEITEFLYDILPNAELKAYFPHKVSLHQSCHGLRGLHLAKSSELGGKPYSKIETLLKKVKGLDLILPEKSDECCGFGGSFALTEAAVSVKMGEDKLAKVEKDAPEFVTATDMSCLMHLEGVFRKNNSNIRVLHLIEILNSQA